MYGQQRWTVPALLVSTTICKIGTEMWLVVSLRSYAVRSPLRVHSEIPITPVHTCPDLSVLNMYVCTFEGLGQINMSGHWHL